MEKLTVDADGKITIPPEVIQKRGLHPGDELALVEAPEGLLVYQGGVDSKTSSGGLPLTKDSVWSLKRRLSATRVYATKSETQSGTKKQIGIEGRATGAIQ